MNSPQPSSLPYEDMRSHVDNSEQDVSNSDPSTVSGSSVLFKSPTASSLKTQDRGGCVLRKRVNFNLKSANNEVDSIPPKPLSHKTVPRKGRKRLRKTRSMGTGNDFHATNSYQMRRKYHNRLDGRSKTEIRNVIFNGTFPIDMPLCSRFRQKTATMGGSATIKPIKMASSPSSSSLESSDDDYYVKLRQQPKVAPTSGLAIEAMMDNKRMSNNLCRLRKEFQESFLAFDRILSRKNVAMGGVRTFDIDAPL
jgi:hypothetical protein